MFRHVGRSIVDDMDLTYDIRLEKRYDFIGASHLLRIAYLEKQLRRQVESLFD